MRFIILYFFHTDELMSLAEQGNHQNVDVMTEDMKIASSDADNIYATAPDGVMVYVHGKAVNKKRGEMEENSIFVNLYFALSNVLILNPVTVKLFNWNFHPIEVVSR